MRSRKMYKCYEFNWRLWLALNGVTGAFSVIYQSNQNDTQLLQADEISKVYGPCKTKIPYHLVQLDQGGRTQQTSATALERLGVFDLK